MKTDKEPPPEEVFTIKLVEIQGQFAILDVRMRGTNFWHYYQNIELASGCSIVFRDDQARDSHDKDYIGATEKISRS